MKLLRIVGIVIMATAGPLFVLCLPASTHPYNADFYPMWWFLFGFPLMLAGRVLRGQGPASTWARHIGTILAVIAAVAVIAEVWYPQWDSFPSRRYSQSLIWDYPESPGRISEPGTGTLTPLAIFAFVFAMAGLQGIGGALRRTRIVGSSVVFAASLALVAFCWISFAPGDRHGDRVLTPWWSAPTAEIESPICYYNNRDYPEGASEKIIAQHKCEVINGAIRRTCVMLIFLGIALRGFGRGGRISRRFGAVISAVAIAHGGASLVLVGTGAGIWGALGLFVLGALLRGHLKAVRHVLHDRFTPRSIGTYLILVPTAMAIGCILEIILWEEVSLPSAVIFLCVISFFIGAVTVPVASLNRRPSFRNIGMNQGCRKRAGTNQHAVRARHQNR